MKNFLQPTWPAVALTVAGLAFLLLNNKLPNIDPSPVPETVDVIETTPDESPPADTPEVKPDVYIFTATWCPSCKKYVPAWKRYYERKGMTVKVVDVDEDPELASQYNVKRVPYVVRITSSGEAEAVPPSVLKYIYLVMKTLFNLIF